MHQVKLRNEIKISVNQWLYRAKENWPITGKNDASMLGLVSTNQVSYRLGVDMFCELLLEMETGLQKIMYISMGKL